MIDPETDAAQVTEPAPRPRMRIALLAGFAIGALLRDVPAYAAEALAGEPGAMECPNPSAILECAFDSAADLVWELLRAILYLVAVCAALGISGAIALLVGGVKRNPFLTGAGMVLVVPATWQMGMLAWHLLT